jgi:uncharacterized integral membrane protein
MLSMRSDREGGDVGQEDGRDVRVEYRGTGFYVSLAVIFLAAVTFLILAVQNTGEVTVEILAFEFDLPLFAVILGAGLVAVILDELVGLVWRRQTRTRLAERAELRSLRAEMETKEAGIEFEETNEEPRSSGGPDHSSPTGMTGSVDADPDSESLES